MAIAILIALVYGATPVPTLAFETEPHPLDTFLDAALDFREPTGIRGTLRYIEDENTVVWIDWKQRSDARPLFTTDWREMPGDAILALHPTSATQFHRLRELATGTPLELVIKDDGRGHRHILSYRDLTQPPEVPL